MIQFTKSIIALMLCLYFGENAFSQDVAHVKVLKTNDLAWIPQTSNTVLDSLPRPSANQEALSARATCFCVVSYNDLTNRQSSTGVCLNLKGVVNHSYGGLNPMSEENRNNCNQRCTNAAVALSSQQKQDIANCACAANIGNSTPIRAYSAVGTKSYKTAQQIGVLVNTPEVTKTTCTCPTDWTSNTTQTAGGVTTDNKCKKLVCGPMSVTPLPPNGTPIGTWGFTWGNSIHVWGTAANGGAPTCNTVITAPKICKLQ